jgi:predicted nucleic acid-binding protein
LIAVDTNTLISAHREGSPFHEAALRRMAELAEGPATWAIPWPCLHEFLAIVTHPRVCAPPTRLVRALDQVA